MYQDIISKNLQEHRGLSVFLDFLKSRNVKLAVGTSAPTMNVDFILDGLGLRSYFDVVVDGLQVAKGKPDPEIYLTCKKLLGVEKAIVFEDALLGIEAGKRAQCEVIGVATTHRRDELVGVVDLIVADFREALQLFEDHEV